MNVSNSILAFFIFFSCSLLAQQGAVTYQWLTTEDGLPDRRIDRILQDSLGFIWLGRNGLHRYDGKSFKTYNSLNTSPVRLAENSVIEIYPASDNRLWLFGNGHTQLLNTQADSIEWSSDPKEVIFHQIRADKGQFWVLASKAEQYSLLRQSENLVFDTIFTFPDTVQPANFVVSKKEKQVWFMNTEKHLSCLNLPQQAIKILDSTSYQAVKFAGSIELEMDKDGKLWVLTDGLSGQSLKYWDNTQNILIPVHFPNTYFNYLNKTSRSIAWFIEKRKMALVGINLQTQAIEQYYLLDKGKDYYRIIEDQQNTLWLASNFGILKIRNKQDTLFKTYLSAKYSQENKLISTRGICKLPDDKALITTYGNGVFLLDTKQENLTSLSVNIANLATSGKSTMSQSYHPIYDKNRNGIWSASEFYYNHFLDLATMTETDVLPNNAFRGGRAILRLDDDHLLIGGERKVERLHLPSQTFTNVNKHGLDFRANCIIRLRSGNIFMGTHKGIFQIDDTGKILTQYHTQSATYRLNSNHIYDLLEDQQGQLWAGTSGCLHCLNFEKESINIFTREDGLPDLRVCGILRDDSGQLWLSTFHGLSRFDPVLQKFWNYFEQDGIANNEFNHTSKIHMDDGLMIFGGIDGITCFYPEQVAPPDENDFPLVLTNYAFYSKDKSELIERSSGLESLQKIELNPYNKFFRFEFALLDYLKPQQHLYTWYLEGFEKNWQTPTAQNFLQYNNVPPGQYTLRIKAASASGTWNAQQLAIQVKVRQVFYKTSWFLTLAVIGMLVLAYLIHNYRLQQALKVERLRTKIASDLHDEVGSLMTRISIGTEMLKTGMYNEEEEKEELEKIARQSREATATMSDVVWSIDARKDKLSDLIDRMREHCEEMLTPAGKQYSFRADPFPTVKTLDLILRQNLYFIFREAINNIVKHSNADQVDIQIKNGPKHFEMHIADNGSDQLQKVKTGQGLSNMRLRADRIQAVLEIQKDKGFKIQLKMPRL